MTEIDRNPVEIRAFGRLSGILRDRNLLEPHLLEIKKPLKGLELAGRLGIPVKEIEVIIVNGVVQSMEHLIQKGDRVAFVPYGTPGPYRVLLGFINKARPADK